MQEQTQTHGFLRPRNHHTPLSQSRCWRASLAASLTSVRVGVSVETKTQNAHSLFEGCFFFFFFFFLEGSEPDRWFIVLLGKRLNSTFSRAEEEPDRPPCPVYGSSCSEQIRGGLKHVSDKAPASDFPRDQTRVEKRSIDANPNSEKSWFSSVLALLLPSRHPPPGLLRNPAAAPLLAPQRSRLNTLWKTLLQASVAAGTCVYLASFKRLFQSFKHPGRRIKES